MQAAVVQSHLTQSSGQLRRVRRVRQPFSTVWAAVHPIIDYLMRGPTDDFLRAPALDSARYVTAYTAAHNLDYTGSRSERDSHYPKMYERLDLFFSEVGGDILRAPLPEGGVALLAYLTSSFARYASGAASVHRVLAPVHRFGTMQDIQEARGWVGIADVVDIDPHAPRWQYHPIYCRLGPARRLEELKRWGYEEGIDVSLEAAEASAEAGSGTDRVVPLKSLALRRFRLEVIEPLMKGSNAPDMTPVGENSNPSWDTGVTLVRPEPAALPCSGRLCRAVEELSQSSGHVDERMRLVEGVVMMLKSVGLRPSHTLVQNLSS